MTVERSFTVVKKVVESDLITSFYLQPVDGRPVAAFRAGQFLTFDLESDSGELVRRTYSLSCSPSVTDSYRISVKLESGGRGSTILHHNVHVGDTLLVHEPRGDFVLKKGRTRPVLLLSGGVGITPLLSMFHELVDEAARAVWFVHACENGPLHALGDEVRELAARTELAKAHFCYREPVESDQPGRDFDSTGFISRQLLQSLLPIDDYDVYLCGPTAFMHAMHQLLISLGVPKERIAYEFFGDGVSLSSSSPGKEGSDEIAAPNRPEENSRVIGKHVVSFSKSSKSAGWTGEHASLLEFAEAQGVNPEFSCREGVCGSCECDLVAGSVEYVEEPLSEPNDGRVLLCCSVPTSNMTLNL